MKDKLDLLLHIDAPTRREVMTWCRNYEAKIRQLENKLAALNKPELDDSLYQRAVDRVQASLKQAREVHLFFTGDNIKVITNKTSVARCLKLHTHVGMYTEQSTAQDIADDLFNILG